ncbi:MAG TPA: hypothetical protein VF522_06335 [Ramlibacter sp.]|uniref:hypothetical protein n=1 Tax=Ramlibacter sp. TaxID=1917967 RepID=UPI002ED483F1
MKRLLSLALVLLLQACAMPHSYPEATDLKSGSDDVVVIGKIELVPGLDTTEQRSRWNVIGEKSMFRMWMATGPEFKPIRTGEMRASEFQGSLEVDWGRPFMVKVPRRRTFLNGGMTWLDVVRQERLWFPGGYYFDVPAGAKAVYIGTLRFHRNDFNTITRVEVIDERRDVAAVLKTAGSAADVTPSLLKRVP